MVLRHYPGGFHVPDSANSVIQQPNAATTASRSAASSSGSYADCSACAASDGSYLERGNVRSFCR